MAKEKEIDGGTEKVVVKTSTNKVTLQKVIEGKVFKKVFSFKQAQSILRIATAWKLPTDSNYQMSNGNLIAKSITPGTQAK